MMFVLTEEESFPSKLHKPRYNLVHSKINLYLEHHKIKRKELIEI